MYPSLVTEGSHSMKPPWIAGSPSKGSGESKPTTTSMRPRIGNKSPTSITALLRDGAEKQGIRLVSSDLKEGKEQIGEDLISDLFAEDDLRIPGLRALLDSPRKLSPRHRREESSASLRSRASSSSLGNDILEADLRSLSLPASDMDVKPSPRTPRQKHIAHVQQVGCFEDEVTRSSRAVGKAPKTANKLPLVPIKSVAKSLDDEAHDKVDKADEWGETDVSLLLPSFSKIEGMERDTQEMSSLFQNPVQLSKAEPAADHEFGDYQPSILSGPKRSPLRGRRSSQEKGVAQMDNNPSKEKSAEPPVKKSYIKLKREPETSKPGMKREGYSALEELCGLMPTHPETERKADKEKMPILNHSETFHQRFFDDADCVNEGAVSPLMKAHKITSPDRPLHQRKFLADHKTTMDKLSKLFNEGDEGEVRVDALRQALVVDAELSESERQKWMGALDHTVVQSQAIIQKWEDYCNGIRKQLDQLVAVLELGVKEVKTMRLDEKDRLDKEHSHIEALQERKEIDAERQAVIRMRKQLVHAEVAFEKQVMEHAIVMQAEDEESTKQRKELERAKEMAAELAEEVEKGQHELQHERHIFEREIASVQSLSVQLFLMTMKLTKDGQHCYHPRDGKQISKYHRSHPPVIIVFSVLTPAYDKRKSHFLKEIFLVKTWNVKQAEMKVESAMGMKKEAAQLKLEAEALRNAAVVKASDIKNQKLQAALAHSELLELKQKHDEERMRLAIERQQICSKRNGHNGPQNTFVQPLASQIPGRPFCDSKPQLLDITAWNSERKRKQGQQVSSVPVRSSLFSNMSSSFGQTPWVVENIEVSLCLQAQEDFLADAKRALENTTYTTNNLVTKAT